MKDLTFHPAADVLPMMRPAELERLAEDIKTNGLIESIVLHPEGSILDGRNRYRACLLAGIEPTFSHWDGECGTPLDFVRSKSNRRDLDDSQRAMAAAKSANLPRGGDRRSDEFKASLDALKQSDAAEMWGVSRGSIQRANRVIDDGAPPLIEAVSNGEIAVTSAVKVVDRPHADQIELLDRVRAGTATNLQQAAKQLDEERRAAGAKPGDDVELCIGDCLELLDSICPAADCVIMDPPYGLDTHRTRVGGTDYADGRDYALALLDGVCQRLSECLNDDAHLYVFSGYSYLHDFKHILGKYFDVQDNPLVWVKNNHTMCDFSKWYANQHEYVLFAKMKASARILGQGHVSDVFVVDKANLTTHSAEKPVELLKYFIGRSTVAGELVLDPFCGSGSTVVAARELGRRSLAFDIEQRWIEVTRGRVA